MNTLQIPIDASTWYEENSDLLSQLGKNLLKDSTRENFRIFNQVAANIISFINQQPKYLLPINDHINLKSKIARYHLRYHLKVRLQRLSRLYDQTYQKFSQHAKPLMALSMPELDQLCDQLLITPNKYISNSLRQGILMRVPLNYSLTKLTTDPYLFICPINWCSNCQKFEPSDLRINCSICSLPLSNDFYRNSDGGFSVPRFNTIKKSAHSLEFTLVGTPEKNFTRIPRQIGKYTYLNFNPVKVLQRKVANHEGRSNWNDRRQILIQAGLIPNLILHKISQYEYYGHSLFSYLQELQIIT